MPDRNPVPPTVTRVPPACGPFVGSRLETRGPAAAARTKAMHSRTELETTAGRTREHKHASSTATILTARNRFDQQDHGGERDGSVAVSRWARGDPALLLTRRHPARTAGVAGAATRQMPGGRVRVARAPALHQPHQGGAEPPRSRALLAWVTYRPSFFCSAKSLSRNVREFCRALDRFKALIHEHRRRPRCSL